MSTISEAAFGEALEAPLSQVEAASERLASLLSEAVTTGRCDEAVGQDVLAAVVDLKDALIALNHAGIERLRDAARERDAALAQLELTSLTRWQRSAN